MRPLALDDLPRHSAWARYLLDPTGDPPTDPEAYTDVATYDEMYAAILDGFRADPVDRDTLVRRVTERGRDDPGPVSVRENVYLAGPDELLALDRFALAGALSGVGFDPDAVLDLGCGYGSDLETIADVFPDATVVGGEYSEHGVALGRELYADDDHVSVEPFDFHGSWDLVSAHGGDALVVTRGAVTTLSDVENVVDRLVALADAGDLRGGVHLEPVDAHPETTLGLLRRRYARERGYDTSLLDLLERREGVEVADVTYDAIGTNPLHPQTVVRWRAD